MMLTPKTDRLFTCTGMHRMWYHLRSSHHDKVLTSEYVCNSLQIDMSAHCDTRVDGQNRCLIQTLMGEGYTKDAISTIDLSHYFQTNVAHPTPIIHTCTCTLQKKA